MVEEASNGKELLLALRAGVGVFPEQPDTAARKLEHRLRAVSAAKMMRFGTLGQLIACALQYPVNQEDAQPYVQRMFRLAAGVRDAGEWHRLELAAFHLNAGDYARQAHAKGDLLAGRQENPQ